MKKAQTLSIVIPVYNEERHIKACLDAVAAQTVKPLEVLVVDNNCTDETVQIARRYPFVKILHERRQGRGSARTTGFNAAKGNIIGRIDADSIIMPSWAERVLKDFQDNETAAVTGLGRACTLPRIHRFHTTLWSRVYFWYVHSYFGAMTTWGANMAVRRTVWQQVKDEVCLDDDIVHEDQDVSLLIAGRGGKIIQDNDLLITTDGQSYSFWPKLSRYLRCNLSTKRHHRKLGTLSRSSAIRLGFWNTLLGRVGYGTLAIPFLLVSLLLWPVDIIASRYLKNWLR